MDVGKFLQHHIAMVENMPEALYMDMTAKATPGTGQWRDEHSCHCGHRAYSLGPDGRNLCWLHFVKAWDVVDLFRAKVYSVNDTETKESDVKLKATTLAEARAEANTLCDSDGKVVHVINVDGSIVYIVSMNADGNLEWENVFTMESGVIEPQLERWFVEVLVAYEHNSWDTNTHYVLAENEDRAIEIAIDVQFQELNKSGERAAGVFNYFISTEDPIEGLFDDMDDEQLEEFHWISAKDVKKE